MAAFSFQAVFFSVDRWLIQSQPGRSQQAPSCLHFLICQWWKWVIKYLIRWSHQGRTIFSLSVWAWTCLTHTPHGIQRIKLELNKAAMCIYFPSGWTVRRRKHTLLVSPCVPTGLCTMCSWSQERGGGSPGNFFFWRKSMLSGCHCWEP